MPGVATPHPQSHIIERPRLLKKLNEAQGRLILLVAPAGYGKTTLARQWFQGRQFIWYQASPRCADVAALAVELADAFAFLAPQAGERMKRRLLASPAPNEEAGVLSEFLIAELAVKAGLGWLVIDDYHHLMDGSAAEEFIHQLVDSSPLNIFVVSRRRPSWLTSRRLVYGDAVELDQNLLAMTLEEGLQLFDGKRRIDAEDLFLQVAGWPAVLALAARTDGRLRFDGMPSELHEFFAEELYATVSQSLRRGLQQLAALSGLRQIVPMRATEERQKTLLAGVELGFATIRGTEFEIHPLLRRFLIEQLRNEDDCESVVTECVRELMAFKLWSEAFDLATDFGLEQLIREVIRVGRKPLLATGRLATLNRWVATARSLHIASPDLDLAEAEIAIRQGRFEAAELVAMRAVSSPTDESCANEGLTIAGTATHMASRNEKAYELFTRARESATTDAEKRRAQWGQFLAAHESDPPLATRLLRELESRGDGSPAEALRLLTQKVMHAWRLGGLQEETKYAEAGNTLLSQTDDPMQRTAFLNAMAGAYNQLAQYKIALSYGNRLQEEADSFKLRFVSPYAEFARVNAYAGLRQYRRAEAVARQVVTDASETGDTYCVFNVRALRARIAMATGRVNDAVELSDVPLSKIPLKALVAEYVTTHALALAIAGDCKAAEETLLREEANFLDGQVDALRRLARIVILFKKRTLRIRDIDALLASLDSAGCFDAFVFTYRAVPELLACAAKCSRWRPVVERVVTSANDLSLGADVGLLDASRAVHSELSARELEVLNLVIQGLRNREIGERLFISEVTVKAHLRRVYAKLGVKSRTEAVVAAADLPGADSQHNDRSA